MWLRWLLQRGFTALMYAAQRGHYGTVELLLSLGCRCEEVNNVGPVVWALRRGVRTVAR